MNPTIEKALGGAASGFLAAVAVDIHAWRNDPKGKPFDWSLAFLRWIAGAVLGALMALGIEVPAVLA